MCVEEWWWWGTSTSGKVLLLSHVFLFFDFIIFPSIKKEQWLSVMHCPWRKGGCSSPQAIIIWLWVSKDL